MDVYAYRYGIINDYEVVGRHAYDVFNFRLDDDIVDPVRLYYIRLYTSGKLTALNLKST